MIPGNLKISILFFFFIIFSCFPHYGDASDEYVFVEKAPPYLEASTYWVDSILAQMTLEEKIGQLIMIQVASNQFTKDNIAFVKDIISKYHIGGIMFHNGGPVRQAIMTNKFQAASKIPLLISQDAEWGLAMRLDSVIKFPRQMLLGAIQQDELLYEFGLEIGKQFNRMGVHMNFAPVIDVNNNPENPVINTRSFGESRSNVARKGYAYMAGMQKQGIIATAKHFPGHGDTKSDSHFSLPVLDFSYSRLDSLEMYPFKKLIKRGLGAIMVGHLNIPQIDTVENLPASLSKRFVSDILQDSLGFEGLIVTDALNMAGAKPESVEEDPSVLALMAGNDILLMPEDIKTSLIAILKAIESNKISQLSINDRCRKVLLAKKWLGLDSIQPIQLDGLTDDLNSIQSYILKRKLVENAVTIAKNDKLLLPFRQLDNWNLASLAIGTREINEFQDYLKLYDDIECYAIRKNSSKTIFEAMTEVLGKYDAVVVSLHNTNNRASKNYGLPKPTIQFVEELAKKTNVILTVFGNPYIPKLFSNLKQIKGVVLAFEDDDLHKEITAQVLYGGIPANGASPVGISDEISVNSGFFTEPIRMKYADPEYLKIPVEKLKQIDSIVINAIEEEAIPGCQIFAAKDGVVFYNKAYGYHTYENKIPVKTTDLYDIASITKIAASTLSLMKLYDQKQFNYKDKLIDYIPELDTTNKSKVICKDALSHYAQLAGWFPFHLYTLDQGFGFRKDLYSHKESKKTPFKVANNLYITDSYKDSILYTIYSSELRDRKKYKYSDLAFYLFQEIIERQTHQTLDSFTRNTFYKPLGAASIQFNPYKHCDLNNIVPTERDDIFRKQLIHGYVHDPGAALLGGVAGHAGLFANANDLAKIMQMLLQKGSYGDVQFLKPKTVETFTRRHYKSSRNRRGLGFDKPTPDASNGPSCKSASQKSFGHTGFTGTIAWADPENNLVYVFLSNRIYPDMKNNKLIKMSVRSKIQEVLYEAVKDITVEPHIVKPNKEDLCFIHFE